MKKLLFSFALLLGTFTFATAQQVELSAADAPKKSCSKSCAKTCAKTASAAAKLASMDESIATETCAKSGAVSYFRKSVCEKSGKVSMAAVKYCTTSKAFVNVSPSEAEGVVMPAKKVSMDASASKKKACSKSCSKSCSKGKAKATTSTATTEATIKMVNLEEGSK